MFSTKIVVASQAIHINKFKHLKRKVLKCCANIYINKQCILYGLTPKFAAIRVPNTSLAARFTQRKLIKIRLRDELKFLYIQKSELNKWLYYMHLRVASEWGAGAQVLLFTPIEDTLRIELQQKYNTIDKETRIPDGYTITQRHHRPPTKILSTCFK